MKRLGFGIIGAGAICPLHVSAIRACPGARLAAVADVSEERARSMGEANGIAWYTDHKKLLEDPNVDVVCVCTPSGLRGPVCIDAARAGKHVIAEKPLEVSLEKADAVIEACEEAGVKLAVIFQLRFTAGMQATKRAVAEGRLGRLVMGDAYVKWRRDQDYYDSDPWRGTWHLDGGGALMNQGIHYVDLLQWIMGPVESLYGQTDTLVRQRIEVEDTAAACLRFCNRALGTIEACTSAYKGVPGRIEIRGERGTIVAESGNVVVWDVEGEEGDLPEAADLGSGAADPKGIRAVGHKEQIDDMVRAINEEREPTVNGREARKAIEIITAIYRSAKTGQPVRLPLETHRE